MNQAEEREHSMSTANDPAIYKSMLVGIVISIIGVFLRFAFDAVWLSVLSWVILLIGAVWCCISVFKILNAK
jgi:hypothetical protein